MSQVRLLCYVVMCVQARVTGCHLLNVAVTHVPISSWRQHLGQEAGWMYMQVAVDWQQRNLQAHDTTALQLVCACGMPRGGAISCTLWYWVQQCQTSTAVAFHGSQGPVPHCCRSHCRTASECKAEGGGLCLCIQMEFQHFLHQNVVSCDKVIRPCGSSVQQPAMKPHTVG